MWFKEMLEQNNSGRKRRRCDKNDEEKEVLNDPTIDWDVGDEMNKIRNYVVFGHSTAFILIGN